MHWHCVFLAIPSKLKWIVLQDAMHEVQSLNIDVVAFYSTEQAMLSPSLALHGQTGWIPIMHGLSPVGIHSYHSNSCASDIELE